MCFEYTIWNLQNACTDNEFVLVAHAFWKTDDDFSEENKGKWLICNAYCDVCLKCNLNCLSDPVYWAAIIYM